MGYAHNPCTDTGTCPIATRLLYNYTQGTAASLLTPVERQAIHQRAAIDSYEQAKSYIVQSLFRIKDDSFRKVACCLVADYLGTAFLSSSATSKQDGHRMQHVPWPEHEGEGAAMDEDAHPSTALLPPPPSDQVQQRTAAAGEQAHGRAGAHERGASDALGAGGTPGTPEGPRMQPEKAGGSVQPGPGPSGAKHAAGQSSGGHNVHALAEDATVAAAAATAAAAAAAASAAFLLAPPPATHHVGTFINNHPHAPSPLADGMTS